MIKVALIVVVTSIANMNKTPDVSITGFYNDFESCFKVMDNIKTSLNTEDLYDEKKIRYLKLPIREAHQEGYIFWSCLDKTQFD